MPGKIARDRRFMKLFAEAVFEALFNNLELARLNNSPFWISKLEDVNATVKISERDGYFFVGGLKLVNFFTYEIKN